MELFLDRVGKSYDDESIFEEVSCHFTNVGATAILGPNGSGKSTLLRIIAGLGTASRGRVFLQEKTGEQFSESDKLVEHCSFSAPYMELPEELTLKVLLNFHFKFKSLTHGMELQALPGLLKLQDQINQPVHQFSSGMKQRLKLGLALWTEAPFVLLDEPLTNLDAAGAAWYHDLIQNYAENKHVIVASNRPDEYDFCDKVIRIEDYKPIKKSH